MSEKEEPRRLFGIPTWLIILGLGAISFLYFYKSSQKVIPNVSYSQFWKLVEEGKVKEAGIKGQELTAVLTFKYQDKSSMVVVIIPQDGQHKVVEKLREAGVKVVVDKPSSSDAWFQLLLWVGVSVLLFFWFFRSALGNPMKKMSAFTHGKARVHRDTIEVTFDDVAGCDEAKEELKEVVEFLRNPKKFSRLGAKIPKGVLLMGAPGTGKTLLARAVAGEARVPFFSISGSDFMEMFVGVGAARVRDLFETAKKAAPCIIFIDEVDAVGRYRGTGVGNGNDEREQTLNQLFVEMDGFDSRNGVIIIAATNRPDILDPAFSRPGRFDRKVEVPIPDLNGRKAIFKVHIRHLEEEAQNKEVHNIDDAGICELAKRIPRASGADIENIVNEGALLATREGKGKIEFKDIEKAIEKVVLGAENKSMVISEKEKMITACHEAGHTLVAELLPHADKVKKVSIIPRSGGRGGVTWSAPDEDKRIHSKWECEDKLAMAVAGRVAEELMLDGLKSTGAVNDIEIATEIAREMVRSWGMSEKLGMVAWGNTRKHPFLGMEIGEGKEESETTSQLIDNEIKFYIDKACEVARRTLKKHIKALEVTANALKEKETLDGEDVRRIIAENPPSD